MDSKFQKACSSSIMSHGLYIMPSSVVMALKIAVLKKMANL